MAESDASPTSEDQSPPPAPDGTSGADAPSAPLADPAADASPEPATDESPTESEKRALPPAEPAASKPEAQPGDDDDSPFAFLRGGHAPNGKAGALTFLAGALVAFLLMARDTQWRWGVPVGFLAVLVAAFGAMHLIGSFDDHTPWRQGKPKKKEWGVAALPPATVAEGVREARAALAPAAATLVTLVTTMSLMAHASGIVWGIAITAGWIAVCVFGFRTLAALGLVDAQTRPLGEREGFWLIVFCCLLYLPTLGAHGLIDPWETHYGEVSREVLARDDWITIWWAEEGFFLSKPILDFWMQALAMAVFGVKYRPDGMIAPAEIGGDPTHPEWIVRMPSLTLSVIALYLAYRAVSQVRGRRAGLLASIVLATTGYWAMLSHQSITDMPFVASLTAAMSLLIIGLTTDDEKTVQGVSLDLGGRVYTVSAFHLAIGVILVCALPQAFYLLSRNVTLVTQGAFGFEPHGDEYRAGSGLECWLAPNQGDSFERLMRIGKWPCDLKPSVHKEVQPAVQGLLWLATLGGLLVINRNERRVSRLCFLVAWVFAAISTMGKGVAGFILPIMVAGAYVLTARKWRDLLRLELVSGVMILAVVAAPWFVAMYVRMGDEFIQQLFVHHMWKRALDHVHDTNTGDDVSIRYYVWQMGYGLFPWTGLVPAGLIWWARTRWQQAGRVLTLHEERQRDVATFLVMWFIFAWALFTYMKTKFHHYVFPAVPPAALLTGIFLDDALGERPLADRTRRLPWLAVTTAGVALAAYGLSRLLPGTFFGASDPQAPVPASPTIGLALGAVGLVLAFVAHRLSDAPVDGVAEQAEAVSSGEQPHGGGGPADAAAHVKSVMVAAVALAGAFCAALVTRDLASRPDADIKGQERLIHLYTYRYDRLWPKEIQFSSALLGFGLAITVLTIVLAARAWRRQAIVALLACGTLFSAWTLDVYMMKIAPHWGQRPLFEAYYKDRKSVKEPLVAFEMNWKGENFYSGGRLIEFGNGMGQGATAGERGSDRMRTWLADIKGKTGAVYFVTEFSRVSKVDEMLRGVLGAPPNGSRWTEQVTNEQITNKFVLVRARWR
jgi:4-amino-4-deoxy-L-arabinose transferase-like glycosyltransferase